MDLQPVHLVRRSGPNGPAGRRGPHRTGPPMAVRVRSRRRLRPAVVDRPDRRAGQAGAGRAGRDRGRSARRAGHHAGRRRARPGRRSRPAAMGWRERAWYVGEHTAALFDRSGNVGPTVWWDGRIVGGWAQRPDGEIAVRLLEDAGAEAAAAISAEAQRLQAWIGPDVKITPRFRTPLERELTVWPQ